MKIQVVSDTHFEFGMVDHLYKKMIETPADVLVLPGDIAGEDEIMDRLLDIQEHSGKQIIFVPGNHEYYHTSRKTLDEELSHIKHLNQNIHVLTERDVCIGGVCFLGSTGWWDGSGGHLGLTVKHGLNDFRMIYDLMDEGNLDGVAWGRKAKTYLSSRMHWMRHNMPDMKLCVVTHHYPHPRSLSPQFAGSPLNVCFGNRWEWMIERYRPELWLHGHTHEPFDYIVKENDGHPHKPIVDERVTRIICNPQGYPSQSATPPDVIEKYYKDRGFELDPASMNIYQTVENYSFDPCKIVEL